MRGEWKKEASSHICGGKVILFLALLLVVVVYQLIITSTTGFHNLPGQSRKNTSKAFEPVLTLCGICSPSQTGSLTFFP